MERETFMTVAEAAQALQVHPTLVSRWIRDGRLPATRVHARLYLLQRADVEQFRESRPRRGWPKGKPRTPAIDAAPPAEQA